MRLYTWQAHGHSICAGTIDHTKNDYPDERQHYPRLFELIGCSNQIVWCTKTVDEVSRSKVLWELEVRRNDMIGFVESIAWSHILKHPTAVPHALYSKWTIESLEESFRTNESRDTIINRWQHEFRAKYPSDAQGLWEMVKLDGPDYPYVQILVRHPVPKEWVIKAPAGIPY